MWRYIASSKKWHYWKHRLSTACGLARGMPKVPIEGVPTPGFVRNDKLFCQRCYNHVVKYNLW